MLAPGINVVLYELSRFSIDCDSACKIVRFFGTLQVLNSSSRAKVLNWEVLKSS